MALSFEKGPAADMTALSSELVRRMNEDARRIKMMEQKVERLENTLNTLEETILMQMNELKISIENIGTKIKSVADRLGTIENDILRINKELGKTATKAEVKQIETFVDLVNPIKAKFVTKDELERALEERTARRA